MFEKEFKSFLTRFLPVFFIPYIGIHLADFSFLTAPIAALEADALKAFGYYAEAIGSTVLTSSFLFDVVVDCSGLFLLILFLALVYATTKDLRFMKKTSVLSLLVALFVFNLVRLFFTAWATIQFGLKAGGGLHFALWFVDSGVVFLAWFYVTDQAKLLKPSQKAKKK